MANYSNYFFTNFNGNFPDSKNDNVNMKFVNAADFKEMILIIYPTGKTVNSNYLTYIFSFKVIALFKKS